MICSIFSIFFPFTCFSAADPACARREDDPPPFFRVSEEQPERCSPPLVMLAALARLFDFLFDLLRCDENSSPLPSPLFSARDLIFEL